MQTFFSTFFFQTSAAKRKTVFKKSSFNLQQNEKSNSCWLNEFHIFILVFFVKCLVTFKKREWRDVDQTRHRKKYEMSRSILHSKEIQKSCYVTIVSQVKCLSPPKIKGCILLALLIMFQLFQSYFSLQYVSGSHFF